MARKKRHAVAEIAAKLLDADALATKGQTQAEIAKTLGVSIMTLHRWRKMRQREAPSLRPGTAPFLNQFSAAPPPSEAEALSRIAELQIENSRLRKLVTDLLLEKMRLEDDQTELHSADVKGKSANRSRAL
jgi:putative transposase